MNSPSIPVAIIANAHTPYRLSLHERIVRELPEVRLHSVFTHEESNAPWRFDLPPDIRPILFGPGEKAEQQNDWKRSPHEWKKAGRILRWMAGEKIQAAVVLGYNDIGRARIIAACAHRKIPCFLFGDSNVKGDTATGLKATAKHLYVGTLVRWSSGVMTCGSLGKSYFERYGADPSRVFYFPYEPDYLLFEKTTAEAGTAFAQEHRLTEGRRRFLFSGRMVALKGVFELVDAFTHLAPRLPDWDLVMVGDGPLRAALQDRVPPSLRQRIQWTGFLSKPTELARAYRTAEVFVLPSHFEPWGVVLGEAAASGLALVATDVVGSAAELIRDNVNGFLVPPKNSDALTRALEKAAAEAPRLGTASTEVLRAWRTRGDPIRGLRSALQSVGILSSP